MKDDDKLSDPAPALYKTMLVAVQQAKWVDMVRHGEQYNFFWKRFIESRWVQLGVIIQWNFVTLFENMSYGGQTPNLREITSAQKSIKLDWYSRQFTNSLLRQPRPYGECSTLSQLPALNLEVDH